MGMHLIKCESLTSVFIPESVIKIGNQAFASCPNLIIYGKIESYAEQYSKENGIPFNTILMKLQNIRINDYLKKL